MKNIKGSVPGDVYRAARIRAAEEGITLKPKDMLKARGIVLDEE